MKGAEQLRSSGTFFFFFWHFAGKRKRRHFRGAMFLEDVFLSFFFFYPPAHVGPIVPVFSAAKLTPRHWSCHEVSEKSWQRDSAIPKLPSILPQQNKKEWRQRVKAVLSADVDFWTIKWILHWIWIFFRQPTCSAMLGTHIKSGCKGRVGATVYLWKGYQAKNCAKILSGTVWSITNIRRSGEWYCRQ